MRHGVVEESVQTTLNSEIIRYRERQGRFVTRKWTTDSNVLLSDPISTSSTEPFILRLTESFPIRILDPKRSALDLSSRMLVRGEGHAES